MKTAAVFSDNMVLQGEKALRIFGTADSDEHIIGVRLPELDINAEAECSDGSWTVILPPLPYTDCCTMLITSEKERIILRNIAIGEVWLAGGQSNMEYELRNEKNGQHELENAADENIRYFYTPKIGVVGDELDRALDNTSWMTASRDNSQAWSAVAWYFAKELSRKTGHVIGIIGCNWGGTSASCWMPREYLEANDEIKPYIDDYDSIVSTKTDDEMYREYEEYCRYQEAWEVRVGECYAKNPEIEWDDVIKQCGENHYPGPVSCYNPMRPCGLYDTMVSHVCPYTLKGVLWYQGECDECRPNAYFTLLSTLIRCWRESWQDDSLPFLIVQLPMNRYKNDPETGTWAILREAQKRVCESDENTALAVAIDCGEFNNIHPVEKSVVGHRLFLAADELLYGGDKVGYPQPESWDINAGRLRIFFNMPITMAEGRSAVDGFTAVDKDGNVLLFSGANTAMKKFVSLKLNRELTSLCDLREVRYLWINYSEVPLFGENGLPVPPFRLEL